MTPVRITPLHPSLGAEVAGVELSARIYHHAWRKGDVLVIDDRATMHRAHGDYDRSQSRVRWRIIVEGDRPRFR
jgi:alpha-ketoglutarate-dependent taurine dioxygenase